MRAAFLAVLLGVAMAVELAAKAPQPGESATTWWAYAWVPVIVVPIALHRRFPAAAAVVASIGIAGYAIGHFVAYPGYAAFVLLFLISLHTGRRTSLLALAVLAVGLGFALSRQSAATVAVSTWVISLLLLAVSWLAGENLRVLRERNRRLEAEREDRARRAVTAERLRIARELHDVVAHSMSVIAVQAGVAHHVIDERPELARSALATVESGARSALVEMRRLLGVLRQEGETATALAPAPTLADVAELVARFREVGLSVELTRTGGGAPEGVELSAYRIVQEALTNVLRHGGPRAVVLIEQVASEVRVRVTDDGPARPGSSSGAGHGLVGMRERVTIFGGTFRAGPEPGGGFTVEAVLPYGEPVAVPGIAAVTPA